MNGRAAPVTERELPLILTKQELAAVLNCSPRHLDQLSKRGLLPRVKLGRCVRYRRETVLRALEGME